MSETLQAYKEIFSQLKTLQQQFEDLKTNFTAATQVVADLTERNQVLTAHRDVLQFGRDEARRQRDQLLAACEEALKVFKPVFYDTSCACVKCQAMNQLRAAIASAEGTTNDRHE